VGNRESRARSDGCIGAIDGRCDSLYEITVSKGSRIPGVSQLIKENHEACKYFRPRVKENP
jgi:hypothetical protein